MAQSLRGGIGHSPSSINVLVQELRHPKIREFDPVPQSYEEVGWLDVIVDNVLRFQELKGCSYLE